MTPAENSGKEFGPDGRVAIFHDNFAQMGGAERVAEALHRALPQADLFSTLSVEEQLTPYLRSQNARNTWMQKLPWKKKLFRHYFLLYPFAVEGVDLRAYDVIISSCFGYAKGVRRRKPGSVHICYCHNPMRWVHRTADYIAREKMGHAKRTLLKLLLLPLKLWEQRAARRPDVFLANSNIVAKRLKEAFGVEAEVVFPPVETSRFAIAPAAEDFYLVLSRLVPYKHIDIAVRACTALGKRLVIIGDGADRERLRALAGPQVEFLGRLSDDEVNSYASRCKALLFTGEEDFGIAPLEVNAAGRPVIAFRAGGATETIVEGRNGLFFDGQTPESVIEAILRFESMTWDPEAIREHAKLYDTAVFQSRIWDVLQRAAPKYRSVEQAVPAHVPAACTPPIATKLQLD